jgi:hypothetical protein
MRAVGWVASSILVIKPPSSSQGGALSHERRTDRPKAVSISLSANVARRESLNDPTFANRAVTALPDQRVQLAAQRREIDQLALYLRQVCARDEIDRLAGPILLVGEIKQRPDLLNRKTEIARAPRERKAAGMCSGIVAVIARRAGRRGQQADALVIADGFRLGIGRARMPIP